MFLFHIVFSVKFLLPKVASYKTCAANFIKRLSRLARTIKIIPVHTPIHYLDNNTMFWMSVCILN
jgi:hypothetical protein